MAQAQPKYSDLVRVTTATTGTGPMVLGSPVSSSYRGVTALVDGATYNYSIIGSASYEEGQGVYTAAGTSLSRDTIFSSSNSGSKITLIGGEVVMPGLMLAEEATAKFKWPVLPEFYGAVADDNGTTGTDNLAAFNKMLVDLKAAGGGRVYLSGKYFFSDVVAYDGTTDLVIEGPSKFTAWMRCAKAGAIVLDIGTTTENVVDFRLKGFEIKGGAATSHACRVRRIPAYRTEDMYFTSSGGDGLVDDRCYSANHTNSIAIANAGYGFHSLPGVAGVGNDNKVYSHCHALANGPAGWLIEGSMSGLVMIGCDAEGNVVGVQLDAGTGTQSESVTLIGLYLENNTGRNIKIGKDTSPTRKFRTLNITALEVNPGTVSAAVNACDLDNVEGSYIDGHLNQSNLTYGGGCTNNREGAIRLDSGSTTPWGASAAPGMAMIGATGASACVGWAATGYTERLRVGPQIQGDLITMSANALMTGILAGTRDNTGAGAIAVHVGADQMYVSACDAGGVWFNVLKWNSQALYPPIPTASILPFVFTAGTGIGAGLPAGTALVNDGHALHAQINADNSALMLMQHVRVLSADANGTNVNTAQAWFGDAGSTGITLPADESYDFEGELFLARTAGTTSHTIAVLFGGTATITSIAYVAESTAVAGNALSAVSAIRSDVATAVVVTGANTDATENNIIKVKGTVRINAGGSLIPQFIYSAAPGGAPVIKRNSKFVLRLIGSKTVTAEGAWA